MKTVQLRALGVLGYIVSAIGLSWPLPRHITTALPGPVGGDTGVYVWNLWLFRHEILIHHRLPYFTSEILSLTPPVDLSLHNYTVFDDILAFPLLPLIGPVATYNLIYLIASVLAATAMFFLALRLCRSTPAAWLAGLLFAWSPALVARGEAHLSLVNAAALPAFVLAFDRWWRTRRAPDALVAGIVVAWAVTSDPYYGVYCVLLAVALAIGRSVDISRNPAQIQPGWMRRVVLIALFGVGCLVAVISATGGFQTSIAGRTIKAYTLYTPVLLLTGLATWLVILTVRPRVAFTRPMRLNQVAAGLAAATAGCCLPLLPFFVALRARVLDGGRFHAPILWRSSPPGVDLLSLVTPNPNHVAFRGWIRPWVEQQPGGFAENVASLTIVAAAVVGIAVWRYGFRPSRLWVCLTAVFALLALGPFVHVAGMNTYVPGPWAFLRYVPVAASARMPARFATPMMMALAVVFAESVAHLARQHPSRGNLVYLAVGVALAFELAPVPRPLYDARVPDIYKTIAADPRPIRIMELPLGFRDGESSYGDFTAASQFYQTFHEKRLIGGYLSRISRRELERQFRFPVIRTLTTLSEGGTPTERQRDILLRAARRFAARARLGYVVIDRNRVPAPLRQLAIDAFGLLKLGEDGAYELYQVPIGALALGPNESDPLAMPAIAPIDR